MNRRRAESATVRMGFAGRTIVLFLVLFALAVGPALAESGEPADRAEFSSVVPAEPGAKLKAVSPEELLTCEDTVVPLAPRACGGRPERGPRDGSSRAIIETSFPGEWRRNLKVGPPEHRLLGLDGGQVISPAGPTPYEAETAGRWLEGYRPGTPEAQKTFEQWKLEERIRHAGRRSMDSRAPTDPASNLWSAGVVSPTVVDDDAPIEHIVREEKYEATKIDLRDPQELLPDTGKATGPPTDYHSSGLTWDEYNRLKELVETGPPTIDGQEALPNLLLSPTALGVSFDAILSNLSSVPPDPIMAVGPNHLVAVVNTRYQVWDKTGIALIAPITLNTFFQGISVCTGAFDPFLDYDEALDRFVMGAETVLGNGDSYLCMAASATNDPTGVWNRYSFRSDAAAPSTVIDYPHMGIGLDAVYISGNMFNETGGFSHVRLFAVDKAAMYAGTAIAVAEASVGGTYFAGQPAKLHGFTSGGWPAPGTPHHIIASNLGGTTRIWRWASPFPPSPQAPVIYGTLGETFNGAPPNAPELGGGFANDTGSGQYFDAEYRDGKLWTTRAVNCNFGGGATESCVDWLVFDVTGVVPTLSGQQSGGAYGSADSYRYYPDISVDRNNNIAIGYTQSSTSTHTGVWVTGRESTDAPGTLQPETLVRAGLGNYTDGAGCNGTCDRWGDYTGMTVDPDGCTFWYLGQFSDGGNFNWKTRVASFKFDSCSVESSVGTDQGSYTCADSMTVSVTDIIPLTASQVALLTTVRALDSADVEIDSETIPAGQWIGSGCAAGSCTKWTAALPVSGAAGSDNDGTINAVDSGSIRTTYDDPHPGHSIRTREVSVNCQTRFDDGGFLIDGGCEQGAGTERYRDYLDGGEYIAYTFGIFNPPSAPPLGDVQVSLSISGPAASHISILNPTEHIGAVGQGVLAGAVFNLYIDPAVDSATFRMSQHDFELSVTSAADGYIVPQVLAQQQLVQADDNIVTESQCFNHETTQGFVSTNYVFNYPCGAAEGCTPATSVNTVAAPWTRGTGCLSETRTDHDDMSCDVGGTFAYKANATAGACSNFAQGASSLTDDLLYSPIFGPAHTGNAANGQPWNFQWEYAEWFYRSDMFSGTTPAAAQGQFWDPFYTGTATPIQNEIDTRFPLFTGYFVYANQSWVSGTPWDPDSPPANYDSVAFGTFASGEATPGMQWRWASELYDADFGNNPTATPATPGLALDNMNLVYEQYHAMEQIGTCGTAPATVSFDQFNYMSCPGGTLELRVMDGDAVGPLTLTVTSDGTGDSQTLSLAGSGPYFTATLPYTTAGGVSPGDGILFVTPSDVLRASYDDGSPVATSTASALVTCRGGAVLVTGIVGFQDNGDGDAFADTNETVNLSLQLRNESAQTLTNVVATLATDSPHIECLAKESASFGSILGSGGTASNSLALDPFTFKIAAATQCSNPSMPPQATFTILVTADGLDGTAVVQRLTMSLDLNDLGTTTLVTESFDVLPAGFPHQLGPGDDDGNQVSPDGNACAPYIDEAFWRSTGGNPGGGMFVWQNPASNFPNGTYSDLVDSEILSPIVTLPAGSTGASLAFDHEYKFGSTSTLRTDGVRVDYSVNGGPFQKLALPYDGPLIFNSYCNPLCNNFGPTDCFSENAANGENIFALLDSGTRFWTRVSGEAPGLAALDQVRFRWRIGTMDLSFYGISQNGGYGLDNVSIGARQQACDTAVWPDDGCSVAFDRADNLIQLCGNGDNVVEPSEVWTVDVTLENLAATDAVNTQATLEVNAGSGVSAIVSGSGNYGTIAGDGGSATATYQFEVDSAAVCIDDLIFDVRNIVDDGGTHPDALQAFAVGIGAAEFDQTATQASAIAALGDTVSSLLNPAFTAIPDVDAATVSYSFSYESEVVQETATRTASFSANNTTAINLMTPAFTMSAGAAGSASLTWTTLTYDTGDLVRCTRVFLRTPNATEVTLKAFQAAAATPYDVLSVYQGPNGGPGQYSIGLEERVGGGCNSIAILGGVSMTVGAVLTGDWTSNAQVSLFDGATSHVLKAFGAPDANPYDVTSIFNGAGPGTYQISVQENGGGGTAFLDSASMNVFSLLCELGCSGFDPGPPPAADGVTGNAVLVNPGAGPNELVFSFDNTTCSDDHAVVLYGTIGDYSGYQGAVDLGCNIGAGPSATVTHAGTNVWFNVIWVGQDGDGGHPGFDSAGPRSWPSSGLCGVVADNWSDNTCN